jgi:hypothetical protein
MHGTKICVQFNMVPRFVINKIVFLLQLSWPIPCLCNFPRVKLYFSLGSQVSYSRYQDLCAIKHGMEICVQFKVSPEGARFWREHWCRHAMQYSICVRGCRRIVNFRHHKSIFQNEWPAEVDNLAPQQEFVSGWGQLYNWLILYSQVDYSSCLLLLCWLSCLSACLVFKSMCNL